MGGRLVRGWKHANKLHPIGVVWHFQLEDHDCDNDCNDAITKRCKTIFSHFIGPQSNAIDRRTYYREINKF